MDTGIIFRQKTLMRRIEAPDEWQTELTTMSMTGQYQIKSRLCI